MEQLKLALIPEYSDTRLYTSLVQDKTENMLVGSGCSGPKELVFYNTSDPSSHTSKNEISRIFFPNFAAAYEFILTNRIKNYNFANGCYKAEIKEFQCSIKH